MAVTAEQSPFRSIVHLAHLPVGKSGTVICLRTEGPARRRLMDLGLIPGTKVETVRRSPAGDPTAFFVRGTVLALRKEAAMQIMVGI